MKLKFVLFATIKNIDKHIETYKYFTNIFRNHNCEMLEPWVVDNYPSLESEVSYRMKTLVQNTNNVVSKADFAVADFSENSRTVFFQTVTALEQKLPVLCLVNEKDEENFPEKLISVSGNLVTVKKYKYLRDLDEIITKYVEDLEAPISKFTTTIRRSTLYQIEELQEELGISKSELIRRVIAKEHRRIFE